MNASRSVDTAMVAPTLKSSFPSFVILLLSVSIMIVFLIMFSVNNMPNKLGELVLNQLANSGKIVPQQPQQYEDWGK